MSKKEPDGYMMPVNGSDDDLMLITPEHPEKYENLWVDDHPSYNEAKPVWLSTEPPVSKEVLAWIEKFKTYIECVQRDRTLPEFLGGEPPNTSEEEYLLDILKKLNLPEQKEHE